MTYFPDFDQDRRRGEEAEALVREMSGRAILVGTCEVKRDDKALATGNVYIEYQCRHADGQWHPSGIETTKANNWAFVLANGTVVVWMPVWVLRAVARSGAKRECVVGSHPTKGFVVPVNELLSRAFAVIAAPTSERTAA